MVLVVNTTSGSQLPKIYSIRNNYWYSWHIWFIKDSANPM